MSPTTVLRTLLFGTFIAGYLFLRVRREYNSGTITREEYTVQRTLIVVGTLALASLVVVLGSSRSTSFADWAFAACALLILSGWIVVRRKAASVRARTRIVSESIPGTSKTLAQLRPEDIRLACEHYGGARMVAGLIGASERVVTGWAFGTDAVPPTLIPKIALLADSARRQSALASSGLPICEWMEASWPKGAKRPTASTAEFDAHQASCPVCKARINFLAGA